MSREFAVPLAILRTKTRLSGTVDSFSKAEWIAIALGTTGFVIEIFASVFRESFFSQLVRSDIGTFIGIVNAVSVGAVVVHHILMKERNVSANVILPSPPMPDSKESNAASSKAERVRKRREGNQ